MEEAKVKPKKTTNAPPPIPLISTESLTTTPDKKKMTNETYRASRGMDASGMKKRKAG